MEEQKCRTENKNKQLEKISVVRKNIKQIVGE